MASQGHHWSSMQERGSLWGMRILLFIYSFVGRRLLSVFLFPVVVYFFLTGRNARRASKEFLQRAQTVNANVDTHLSARFRHFYNFALAAFDKIDAWLGKVDINAIEYTNQELFNTLNKDPRGAIFIGSHLGNLEVCRAMNSAKYQRPMNVLVFTQNAIKFNEILQQINPNVRMNMIEVVDITPGLMIQLREKIDMGESLVIVGDRTSQSVAGRVSYVDFLGHKAPFAHGPFILASLLECPIYLLFCIKQKNHYKVIFELFSQGLSLPRKTRQQRLDATLATYAQRLGYYAASYPYQWYNFFDFWQKDEQLKRTNTMEKH
jgi:predicted LPLAT superfamily acyltransferase